MRSIVLSLLLLLSLVVIVPSASLRIVCDKHGNCTLIPSGS